MRWTFIRHSAERYDENTRDGGNTATLVSIPDIDTIVANMTNKVSFSVTDGKGYIVADYDPESISLTICYAGQVSYKSTYNVMHIDEEDVRYFAVENILCPVKGTPSVIRFYEDPVKTAKEANEAVDLIRRHEWASEFGSRKELIVLDIKKVEQATWYKKNMRLGHILKEHQNLETPENFQVFVSDHLELLRKILNSKEGTMKYRNIKQRPSKNETYLVKFYNKSMPEYDCTELVYREFKDGEWVNPVYSHAGDGYELVGWYES